MNWVKIGLLLVIIGGAVGSIVVQNNRWENRLRASADASEGRATWGGRGGRVEVVAIIPFGRDCHAPTLALMQALARVEPERTKVEIYDMYFPAGQTAMAERGVECATILVNGKSQFTVERDGNLRSVTFMKNPDGEGSTYRTVDIIAAVDQELTRVYGTGLAPEAWVTLTQAGPGRMGVAASADPREVMKALGPPRQPLVIEAVYPLRGMGMDRFFDPTRRWLKALAKTYPDQVTLHEYYMPGPEATEKMEQWGVSCSGLIAINGKITHSLQSGGKSRTVQLAMNSREMRLTYDLDDLREVLRAYLQEEASGDEGERGAEVLPKD